MDLLFSNCIDCLAFLGGALEECTWSASKLKKNSLTTHA